MRYLKLTEFQLIPRERLQKKAVKLFAWSAGAAKHFENSYKGKAMIGLKNIDFRYLLKIEIIA